jgi:hypothetical protein
LRRSGWICFAISGGNWSAMLFMVHVGATLRALTVFCFRTTRADTAMLFVAVRYADFGQLICTLRL